MLSVITQTQVLWPTCTVLYCSSLLYVLSSYWQIVPRQPAQQAEPQCSLNSTETCANAFSPWPLLFYLIIQNSVNLNLIAVCHGEAHWACVREQLLTMHTAAGPPLFEAHLELGTSRLVVCHGQMSWRHTGLRIKNGRQRLWFFSSFLLCLQISVQEDTLRLEKRLFEGTITQLSTSLLTDTFSVISAGPDSTELNVLGRFIHFVSLLCFVIAHWLKAPLESIQLNCQSVKLSSCFLNGPF